MQASIKVLRLAQITGGFLGGIGDFEIPEMDMGEKPEWMKDGNTINLPGSFLDGLELKPEGLEALQEQEEWAQQVNIASTQEIGREKLDILLWFLEKQLYDDPNFRTVAWVRFRAELSRMLKEVSEKFPQFRMGAIHGGQKRDERAATMALLHPDTTPPTGPIFVGGTYGTGSFGLNFTAANTSINVSFDYSLGKYLQSRDRVYGPGQTKPVAYFDILAVGPKGQKTIDHVILKARKESEEIANWTTEKWVKALKEE
jgi:hypothetical protein